MNKLLIAVGSILLSFVLVFIVSYILYNKLSKKPEFCEFCGTQLKNKSVCTQCFGERNNVKT